MIEFLHAIRKEEFNLIFQKYPISNKDIKVLEIGSGTGFQLELLDSYFKDARGIEIEDSIYANLRHEKIILYNGRNIPFNDQSFDIIFSSNVMEHIPHLAVIEKEYKRLLKPGGICIHVMPTHTWKFWSICTHYAAFVPRGIIKEIKQRMLNQKLRQELYRKEKKPTKDRILNMIFPERHGERGNVFTEIFYFYPQWWLNHFESEGWHMDAVFSVGLFYTGNNALGKCIGMKFRKKISRILGSSCYAYVMKMPD